MNVCLNIGFREGSQEDIIMRSL